MIPDELTPMTCIDTHVEITRGLRTTNGADIMSTLAKYTASGSGVPAYMLADTIDASDTFLVTAEMLNIASEASVDLDGMPLFPQDMPSRNMLIFLDNVGWDYFSYVLDDDEPDVLGMADVRALSIIDVREIVRGEDEEVDEWMDVRDFETGEMTKKHGVLVLLWADAEDVAEKAFERGIIEEPRLFADVGGMFPIDITGWTYGTQWKTLTVEETIANKDRIKDMAGHVASHVGEMRRQILSMLLLMNEEIYSERERLGERPARRRWERSSLKTPEDFSIGVTRLRRYHQSPEQHEDSEAYHNHRWYVRGHWRRLHKGTPQEKAVWVRPYIKGPEHAPLIEKFRVTALDR